MKTPEEIAEDMIREHGYGSVSHFAAVITAAIEADRGADVVASAPVLLSQSTTERKYAVATTVKTQDELDKALSEGVETIYIESDAGVWLTVTDSDSSSVVARGSSRVVARDSSRVVARDSSSVEARDSSRVVAWGSSSVEASKYVAIHLHSKRVNLSGDGHVIDVTDINTNEVEDFIAYHGVKVVDGDAILYKAVDQDLNAGHHHTVTNYPIGGVVTAHDWRATTECGYGLHFGYRPAVAGSYFSGEGVPRFLEVRVPVVGLVALGDKAKSESCLVIREVDVHGDPV